MNTLSSPSVPMVRLGQYARKIGSGLTPLGGHTSYLSSGVPLIRSQNVRMNRFDPEGLVYISTQQHNIMNGTHVQPGDVLLNITGASIGRVCVVPSDICPANVNQHVSIIRLDDTFCPEFVALYLSTPQFQQFIASTQAGATRQALTKGLIEGFSVPRPSLEQQRCIAAKLRKQIGAVELARQAAESQQEAAALLPRTELALVLTALAKYPRRPLSDLADFLPAKSIATAGDADVTAVTTACLSELFFDESGLKRAKMLSQDVPECILSPGEVLIARSNTPDLVGRACLFPGSTVPTVASDLTIRLRPKPGTNAAFLARYFSYLFLTGYWKEHSGGASGSMKKITRSQLRAERVPSPPEPDQERIADDIAARMSSVHNLTSSLREQTRLIDAFPPALLREAFSGRL